ncbi:unnamed protein product, partial [Urochloa humidicola]
STYSTEQSLLSSLLSHASMPPAPCLHAGVHPAGAAPPRRRSRASRAHPEYTLPVAALHTAPILESPRVSTAPEPLEHAPPPPPPPPHPGAHRSSTPVAGLLLWIRSAAPIRSDLPLPPFPNDSFLLFFSCCPLSSHGPLSPCAGTEPWWKHLGPGSGGYPQHGGRGEDAVRACRPLNYLIVRIQFVTVL